MLSEVVAQFETKLGHPERSRFSGGAKDLARTTSYCPHGDPFAWKRLRSDDVLKV